MAKKKHARTKRENPAEVTETKDFAATIEVDPRTGKNGLKISAPSWYQHQLNKFKPGEKVSLYVSSRRPKRTSAQNRYYWLFLTMICEETGETNPERLHRLFAGMFLCTGIAKVFGKHTVRDVRSTTSLSKAEFSEYIDKIAAETGVQPPPTQGYLDDGPQLIHK